MGGGSNPTNVDNNTEITFEDTSQFMFRDSSINTAGFDANLGSNRTNTDLDIDGTELIVIDRLSDVNENVRQTRNTDGSEDLTENINTVGTEDIRTTTDVDGTEDIRQTTELLLNADRERLRETIETMTRCTIDQLCADKVSLEDKAMLAWERAINLYPEFKEELNKELEDMKTEMLNIICSYRNSWSRIAGSSLNTLVAKLTNEAHVDLSRRLMAVVAERLQQFRRDETDAIARAFQHNLQAKLEPTRIAVQSITALYGVLRGASSVQITDRDYTEDTVQLVDRDYTERVNRVLARVYSESTVDNMLRQLTENVNEKRDREYEEEREESIRATNLAGRFYHEGKVISDSEDTYEGQTDQLASGASAIANGASNLLGSLGV